MKAKKAILVLLGFLLVVLVFFTVRNPKTVRLKVHFKNGIVRLSFVEGELHPVNECRQMLASAIVSDQVRLVVSELPEKYPEESDKNLRLVNKALTDLVLAQNVRYVYYWRQKDGGSIDDISFIFIEVPYEEPMNLDGAKVFLDGLECGRGEEGMRRLVEECQMKSLKCLATVLGRYTGTGNWPSPSFHTAIPEKYQSEIRKIIKQKGGKEIRMQYFLE